MENGIWRLGIQLELRVGNKLIPKSNRKAAHAHKKKKTQHKPQQNESKHNEGELEKGGGMLQVQGQKVLKPQQPNNRNNSALQGAAYTYI